MAFHNPITVDIFGGDDKILGPIMNPISVTYNLEAFSFNYLAVQVDTDDRFGNEVYQRFINGEHLQYRVSGRFGVDTGDINSVYKYRDGKQGELSLYGRSHKELLFTTLGFPSSSHDVPQGQATTHKRYSGSELAIIRGVLEDNLKYRLGVPMRSQSGNLGRNFVVDFRFDEIGAHLYEDSKDRGGLLLKENGDIIVDIIRDFDKREYVLSARLQEHHVQPLTDKGGNVSRYQATFDRGEASRLVIGGPGEMLDRLFVDMPYPEPQYSAGMGAKVEEHSDRMIRMADDHKAALDAARDRNASDSEIRALEAAHEQELKDAHRDFNAAARTASGNRPTPAHPNRGHQAEAFTENTSPDVSSYTLQSASEASIENLVDAIRDAGEKSLEELGRKGGMAFNINETDQVYMGPGGAFQLGDWVRIEADGVDFGEVRLEKAVASFTRDGGYEMRLSDTDLAESAESAQVDRIIKALRELTKATRRA